MSDGGRASVHLLLLIAAQAAAPYPSSVESTVHGAAHFRIIPEADECRSTARGAEIVVCGRRGANDTFRIPQEFRDQREAGRRIGGIGSASVDPGGPVAPCGVFQGQRKCYKEEAAEYGWGRGRDPITVAAKIISALADPE